MTRSLTYRRLAGVIPRVGHASFAEIDYFCRNCKGHFTGSVPVTALYDASCRCGSRNLLVYNISGDMDVPARQRGRTA